MQKPGARRPLIQIGCAARRKTQAIAGLLPSFATQPCGQDVSAASVPETLNRFLSSEAEKGHHRAADAPEVVARQQHGFAQLEFETAAAFGVARGGGGRHLRVQPQIAGDGGARARWGGSLTMTILRSPASRSGARR